MERNRRSAVVVDELAMVRLGLATVLRSVDVEVVAETPSGREAAELFGLHQPALVVVGAPADMPVLEAVRRARAAAEAVDGAAADAAEAVDGAADAAGATDDSAPDPVRIVALLGAGQVDTVAAVVAAGADGLTLRGGASGDLAAAFAEVLAGRRYVAPTLSPGLLGRLEAGVAPESNGDALLTYREREVLALLASGATNREIATTLTVTLATVKSHLVHVYAKLGVRNRHEALSRAVGLGLLT